ncbi:hypothetical protein LZD49_12590 [Dyadobacter sp. CY261]|uniref:hypothetical protein n=1 Tax=Dyadobacter sp. CY261 TaxID=2907203 RepID=UPI001F3A7654|nr:hypothetical protein [Dyadobacter sp. CY261]MCF0071311.1 hypothetical protein [Dyadobacter sp. CY261]
MKPDTNIKREALGAALAALPTWRRSKIKSELKDAGFTENQWKRLLSSAEAHKVPAFVRDIIVNELPDTAHLFNHPNLKAEAL